MAATATPAWDDLSDEERAAALWRRARFLELGFGRELADLLAYAGADWHQAEALIVHGCGHVDAARILS